MTRLCCPPSAAQSFVMFVRSINDALAVAKLYGRYDCPVVAIGAGTSLEGAVSAVSRFRSTRPGRWPKPAVPVRCAHAGGGDRPAARHRSSSGQPEPGAAYGVRLFRDRRRLSHRAGAALRERDVNAVCGRLVARVGKRVWRGDLCVLQPGRLADGDPFRISGVFAEGAGTGMAHRLSAWRATLQCVRIPTQSSRRFRSIPASDSDGSQPLIPMHPSHP